MSYPNCVATPASLSVTSAESTLLWGDLSMEDSYSNSIRTNQTSRLATDLGDSRSNDASLMSLLDKMTELIKFQKSNGTFEIPPENWRTSGFEEYAGIYEDVHSSCPAGVKSTLWITALAIQILELKMSEKKDLWELIAKKGRKSILAELNQDMLGLPVLLAKAEKYIMER